MDVLKCFLKVLENIGYLDKIALVSNSDFCIKIIILAMLIKS